MIKIFYAPNPTLPSPRQTPNSGHFKNMGQGAQGKQSIYIERQRKRGRKTERERQRDGERWRQDRETQRDQFIYKETHAVLEAEKLPHGSVG